ncbi:transposase IS3/IS911 family protein [Comamonas testosteroni ATCC 11996]|nr:transposase IS3/IS911 family protein [Comamonas testosteroni ATCC 11996]
MCAADLERERANLTEVDAGVQEGLTISEARRMKALAREVKELRRANEILKLVSAFSAQAELDRRFKSWRTRQVPRCLRDRVTLQGLAGRLVGISKACGTAAQTPQALRC